MSNDSESKPESPATPPLPPAHCSAVVTVYESKPCTLMLADMKRLHQRINDPQDLEDALLSVAVGNAARSMALKLEADFFAKLYPPNYQIPLNIFGKLLALVGERAIELNDPKLNALMCRLTIYTIADPESQDYDPETVRKILEEI